MNLRLLTTPWLVSTLLLGTLSCKKDEPAPDPTPTPTAGYTINNRNVKCTATGTVSSVNGIDLLVVTLKTTPQPTSGPEVFTITFAKPTSAPFSDYNAILSNLTVSTNIVPTTTLYDTTVGSLQNGTTSGKISGSFTTYLTVPPNATITGGCFTDIQL